MTDTSIPSLLSHFPSEAPLVPVINPSNGKRIFDLPQLSAHQVQEAVAKARHFAPTWAATPAKERQAVLRNVAESVDFAFGYVHHFVGAAMGKAESVQEVARYYLKARPTMATFLSNHDIFAGRRPDPHRCRPRH